MQTVAIAGIFSYFTIPLGTAGYRPVARAETYNLHKHPNT